MTKNKKSNLEKKIDDIQTNEEPALFSDYGGSFFDLFGPIPPIIARIKFPDERNELRGSWVLAKSGGYARYKSDLGLYGIVSKRQLCKLKWRFIKYEIIDYFRII